MMLINVNLWPPVIALLLVLFDKHGSSFTAPKNTKGLPRATSLKLRQDTRHDPKGVRLMEQPLSSSNSRNLQTCTTTDFTFNACANCCGYKFTTKAHLEDAINGYPGNQDTFGEMNCWDVSEITDMSQLFVYRFSFDVPIGCWNVSKVTDMSYMFFYATNFNQNIGNWNVGSVTDMTNMFANSGSFNQDIGHWNVSKVTTMIVMFARSGFNQAIENWDVSKVNDMSSMFFSATSFNQDLCAWYNNMQSTTVVINTLIGSGCTDTADPNLSTKSSFCQACTCSEGK